MKGQPVQSNLSYQATVMRGQPVQSNLSYKGTVMGGQPVQSNLSYQATVMRSQPVFKNTDFHCTGVIILTTVVIFEPVMRYSLLPIFTYPNILVL